MKIFRRAFVRIKLAIHERKVLLWQVVLRHVAKVSYALYRWSKRELGEPISTARATRYFRPVRRR